MGGQANHIAEGAVDVEDAALGVSRAQPHQGRIFHGLSPGGFGAPGTFGARDLAHLAAQQHGGHQHQRQKAAYQHHRQGAPERPGYLAQGEFQVGTGHVFADLHLVAFMGLRVQVQRHLVHRGDGLVGGVEQLHIVFARHPPRRATA